MTRKGLGINPRGQGTSASQMPSRSVICSCNVDVLERNSVLEDDGLIGADVFQSFLVDIDFPDKKFKLTQLPAYPDAAPAEITLESRPAPASQLRDRYIAPEMKDYTQVLRFAHALLIFTRVNDSAPMLFMMDTGGFDNMITPAAAKQVTKISRDQNVHLPPGWIDLDVNTQKRRPSCQPLTIPL
jgi:hypothetical protein